MEKLGNAANFHLYYFSNLQRIITSPLHIELGTKIINYKRFSEVDHEIFQFWVTKYTFLLKRAPLRLGAGDKPPTWFPPG